MKASEINLFPSTLFPLIAKKTSSFLIVFELIEILLILSLFGIAEFDTSLIIFNFKLLDKDLFLNLIDFKII